MRPQTETISRMHQLRRATQNHRHLRLTQEKGSAPVEPLKMALARDIQILESAYLVGKRKPVSELPQPWRWLARKVYQYTGWASDYGIETQAICTSRELADEMAEKGGANWFVQELPINTSLPDETCKFRLMTFPGSDAPEVYDNRRAPFDAVPHRDVEELAKLDNKLGKLHECLVEGKRAKAL